MTTQDLRALIARLQARLGEGTPTPVSAYDGDTREIEGVELAPIYTLAFEDVGPGDVEALVGYVQPYDARTVAALLNELPAQIARWLARLDEADETTTLADHAKKHECSHLAVYAKSAADTLLATVTEDVQAWAVRLGVV